MIRQGKRIMHFVCPIFVNNILMVSFREYGSVEVFEIGNLTFSKHPGMAWQTAGAEWGASEICGFHDANERKTECAQLLQLTTILYSQPMPLVNSQCHILYPIYLPLGCSFLWRELLPTVGASGQTVLVLGASEGT